MPRFSAFSQHGQQRFSSRKPYGQTMYEDKVRNLGAGRVYSDEWGSIVSAELYADAMTEGTTRHFLERVGSQFRPLKAVELLPFLEKKYGVIPTATATIPDRQRTVAAAAKTSRGAKRENVIAVLTTLLGSDFIGYFTVGLLEIQLSSNSPGSVGNYVKPGTLSTLISLDGTGVSTLGSDVAVPYTFVAGHTEQLKAGQKIWVDGGHMGRAETVTLVGVTDTDITATFTKPHDAGTLAMSGRAPFLAATKRHNFFLVTAAVARNPEKRRQIHRSLRKLLRGVSTWDILEENSPGAGVSGPFMLGVSEFGFHSISEVSAS